MKRRFFVLMMFVFIFAALPVCASADFGPKPSVKVKINGISGEKVYGTLLTEQESTGPYGTVGKSGAKWQAAWDGADEIGRKFLEYDCPNGLNYLLFYDDCSDGEFDWSYYPPQSFTVLLYFPERDEFLTCGSGERYAFESTFEFDIGSNAELTRNYDYSEIIFAAAIRFLLTVVIEIGLGLAFGFRAKRQILLLFGANFVTQLGLNLALGFAAYKYGGYAETALYIALEIAVFAIEAVVYSAWMKRLAKGSAKKCHPILYAFIANAASFAAGIVFA